MRQLSFLAALVLASACVDRSIVGAFGADGGASDEGGTTSEGGEDGASATTRVEPSTTRLAVGGLSTCAIDANSGVKCWGDNQHGTLGIGSFVPESSTAPVAVRGLTSDVRSVAGGPYAHCAVLVDGTARCWGTSLFGDPLGTGSFDSADMPTAHDKFGLADDVAQISFGTGFACAVTTSGGAKCWGHGGAGQLGSGTTDDAFAARDVAGLDEPIVQISASMGGFFACGVTASGRVSCWGENGEEQLGTSTPKTALPSYVAGLDPDVVAVGAGRAHACALYKNGSVDCWGSNANAQLGSGRTGGPSRPRKVAGVESAVTLAVGSDHACAIVADKRTLCWGENGAGEVGSSSGPLGPTVTFPADFAAVAVGAGFAHTCALDASGHVRCVGSATRGQTGDGAFSL